MEKYKYLYKLYDQYRELSPTYLLSSSTSVYMSTIKELNIMYIKLFYNANNILILLKSLYILLPDKTSRSNNIFSYRGNFQPFCGFVFFYSFCVTDNKSFMVDIF